MGLTSSFVGTKSKPIIYLMSQLNTLLTRFKDQNRYLKLLLTNLCQGEETQKVQLTIDYRRVDTLKTHWIRLFIPKVKKEYNYDLQKNIHICRKVYIF